MDSMQWVERLNVTQLTEWEACIAHVIDKVSLKMFFLFADFRHLGMRQLG